MSVDLNKQYVISDEDSELELSSDCCECIDEEEYVELDDATTSQDVADAARVVKITPNTSSADASASISASASASGTGSASVSSDASEFESESESISVSEVKYAPFIEPRVIKGNLYGASIDWLDENPKGNIGYMTNSVAKTYRDISGGFANFTVVAKVVKVNYDAEKKNLAKGEKQAIVVLLKGKPKGPNDYFLLVNGFTRGSHTSITRHICHLANTLITTANHENGHSLRLLHSNVLVPGKPKEGSSRDGTSFMSIYSSGYLTAVQTYYMGWLNKEVALYDFPEKVTYRIQKFNSPLEEGNLKAVILANVGVSDEDIINPVSSQPLLFLSYPKFKNGNHLALHTSYGNNLGSTRHKVFASNMEYQGFIIEKTAEDNDSVTVQVSRSSPTLP